MSVETRKLEIKNVFNNWKLKNSSVVKNSFNDKNFKCYERDVLRVTEKWRTIKTPPIHMGSGNSVDVFNHENSEQFINYVKNEERNESNHLCGNREFWTEKMIPLMKEEDSDWESNFELEDRLDDMNKIGFRHPTSYQMNQ